ncbi:MAG: SGNH/GDSL hydrolase family protein [Candidatus Omnitrophica bacterium]|nr:SGNH/GDSL hydrolase family protein [Candidatus Omnitrophota bacterium]
MKIKFPKKISAFLAFIFIGCAVIFSILFLIVQQPILSAMYHREMLFPFDFLNGVIEGQRVHPISFYESVAVKIGLKLLAAWMGGYILILVFLGMPRETRIRSVLVLFSIGAMIIFSEFLMRWIYSKKPFYLWPPKMERTISPDPEILPGVSGISRFRTNSWGIRGDEIPEDNQYRILTAGGSAVESATLDQDETWSYLLEEKLKKEGFPVWIGNVGKSGLSLRGLRILLRYLLPEIPRVDMVIMLIGVNDLWLRLRDDMEYEPMQIEPEENIPIFLSAVFSEYPLVDRNIKGQLWSEQSGIIYGMTKLYAAGSAFLGHQDVWIEDIKELRQRRQDAIKIREQLPDLSSSLREYRFNIERIIILLKQHNITSVFLTHPVMWRGNLPPSLEALLWAGNVGDINLSKPGEYYSVETLAEGMRQYNELLLKICEEQKLYCYDLAGQLSQDETAFFDDCHFNESGGRMVADMIGDYLLQEKPWSQKREAK